MTNIDLYCNDCVDILKNFDDNVVDSIVTDPPAGISFLNKEWDNDKGGRDSWILWMENIATECLRVLKPGGHALVWSIPRTSHWTAFAWENAGFETRDIITHIFGSGFPKGLNISKAIDKQQGIDREILGYDMTKWRDTANIKGSTIGKEFKYFESKCSITKPESDLAKRYEGYGTNLKPACEFWLLLRKPMSEKTIAGNVMRWGTGGINIDGCRIESEPTIINKLESWSGFGQKERPDYIQEVNTKGRFPAHLIHDGSDDVLDLFPNTESGGGKKGNVKDGVGYFGSGKAFTTDIAYKHNIGSAARFFYCAKPSKRERNEGCEEMEKRESQVTGWSGKSMPVRQDGSERKMLVVINHHPTLKPLALMKYLCRLITPPNGVVLDPFMGSGTTGIACVLEGFDFIGIEREQDYFEIAKRRINHHKNKLTLDI